MQRALCLMFSGLLLLAGCVKIDDPPLGSFDDSQTGAGSGASGMPAAPGGRGGMGARAGASAGAGGARSGSAGVAAPEATGEGLAAVGSACTMNAAKACAGPASTSTLVCTGGTWAMGPECAATERCDTLTGETQGTCLPMLSLCAGKKAGDVICDANTRRKCGADLVRFDADPCPEHAHCEASAGAPQCACDLNYKSDGSGDCVPNVVCPAKACSPGGRCVVGAADYACECDVEFEGTGTKACMAVGRCAETNVCSAEYVCRSKDASYVCRGQFADWPMSSTIAGAKTGPKYNAAMDSVLDGITNLTWQRHLPLDYPGCTTTCTWERAKAYCDTLALDGKDDWRLPTMIELVSILDDNAVMPSIDAVAFPNTPPEGFWSASTNAGANSQAWSVGFAGFQVVARAKTDALRVRCVR